MFLSGNTVIILLFVFFFITLIFLSLQIKTDVFANSVHSDEIGCTDDLLTRLCQATSSTLTLLIGPFQIEGVSSKFLLLPCFIEITVFNANSVDPDQMQHTAASDLGLSCLPMSILWDARHKRVKEEYLMILLG